MKFRMTAETMREEAAAQIILASERAMWELPRNIGVVYDEMQDDAIRDEAIAGVRHYMMELISDIRLKLSDEFPKYKRPRSLGRSDLYDAAGR